MRWIGGGLGCFSRYYILHAFLSATACTDMVYSKELERDVTASAIPVRSHTFVEIDHEIFLRSFSSLPLIYSRRVVVSYKRKYVHELLVNRLFKPAQEKVWLGELTVPQ